jgi:DNA mismatch endonuclease (patch repair protein)
MPRSRQDYWIPKFQRTRERDKTNAAILRAAGWKILIVWECETNDEVVLRRRLKAFLSRP